MLVFLWAIIFASFLSADNVVDSAVLQQSQNRAESSLDSAKKGAHSTSRAQKNNDEITRLENNAKHFKAYTKRYQKRNYGKNPFSSEWQDYKDSVLIDEGAESSADSAKNGLDSANLADLLKKRERPKVYKKLLTAPKPKVVIIIDDIANPAQLNALQSIGLKLTPSIFPVSESNAKMREAVAKLDFFMVHLPLEALTYHDEMETIKLNDSAETITQKIAQIKQNMPKTRYINNHTGSKFTANKENMELLLRVLDLHNINFVDSRTTPNTALPNIAQEQNRLILSRDIFIDNALDSASLNTQINEGIKIAKERGYAILIAHPHKETLLALKRAKEGALREVDVIYLNELDSALKRANIKQYAKSKLPTK